MIYTFLFFTSLVLTILLTPYLIEFLTNSEIVDRPHKRRINEQIIPRMGGIVIFSILMLLVFSFFRDLNEIRLIIISSLVITFCGTIDDIIGLKWSYKFLLQGISVSLIIIYLDSKISQIGIFGLTLPYPFDYLILIIFMVGLINAINLLDGLDGLASGFSLLVFATFFVLAHILQNELLMIVTATLAGSILGFLKYNAYPAKIFLGDTGSLMLGFFLVVVSILLSIDINHSYLDLTFPIMIMGVPIIDTLKVMFVRIIRKNNPFQPDKTHIHHVILNQDVEHKLSVFIVKSFTLLFIVDSLLYFKGFKSTGIILFFVLSIILIAFEFIIKKVKRFTIVFNSYYLSYLNKLPKGFITTYSKLIIPLGAVVAGISLLLLVPTKTSLNSTELVFLMVLGILVSLLAFIHYKRTKEIAGIYVLLNITVFFVFCSLSESFYKMFEESGDVFLSVFNYLFFFILLIIITYIILREKLFSEKDSILTGLDFTLILFFSLLFVINNIVEYAKLHYLILNLYHAFGFYLLFKLISNFKDGTAKYIFIFSFFLPFISIVTMFLIN